MQVLSKADDIDTVKKHQLKTRLFTERVNTRTTVLSFSWVPMWWNKESLHPALTFTTSPAQCRPRKEGDMVYTLSSGTVKLTSGQQRSGTQSLSQTVQQPFSPSHLPCLNPISWKIAFICPSLCLVVGRQRTSTHSRAGTSRHGGPLQRHYFPSWFSLLVQSVLHT